MKSNLSPMLPALTELWKERGWSLESLRGFRMEGDGGSGDGGAGGGTGGTGGTGSGEGGTGAGGGGTGGTGDNEPLFPPHTPVAEMTPGQAIEYWKHQSRKHEARASQRADYDEIKAKAEKYDTLESASKTEQERAVETAKTDADAAARADERKKAAVQIVDAEMRAAAAGKLTAELLAPILEPLDRTKFLTDTGEVDLEKVTTFVASIAPGGAGGNGNGGGFPNLGQGNRGDTGGKPTVTTGVERYAARHPKKT